ncbi:unnamed protein product [Fusarium graminearum]|uniref:Uncharacterized protein n=1 Tax=Gibberella zeae TaxID=5518 RepID=A0A4E9EQE9_GIBZA|nr:unnamed protein product [Fusarium graminearum]CAF3596814.1 unnamed protein product [Fusarium graminearum]CAG1959473.1 unnamed protein product [Fusarium graminearum]CAG1984459.1 unnamed protein product [Fusarium graminearum]
MAASDGVTQFAPAVNATAALELVLDRLRRCEINGNLCPWGGLIEYLVAEMTKLKLRGEG